MWSGCVRVEIAALMKESVGIRHGDDRVGM